MCPLSRFSALFIIASVNWQHVLTALITPESTSFLPCSLTKSKSGGTSQSNASKNLSSFENFHSSGSNLFHDSTIGRHPKAIGSM
uniref:Putative secreted protein n=1 Tax=Panstrongylus lignarius TaxID=156445 RepID=A0A224XZC8_9HEMI